MDEYVRQPDLPGHPEPHTMAWTEQERVNGYDIRADVDDCSEWGKTPNVAIKPRRQASA